MSTSPQTIAVLKVVFAFMLGSIVGSFLNAYIYRWPLRISMWKKKRSFCPNCKATIAWYDNIPIVSYLLLRGRCRSCGKPIHVRYLIVEVLTASLFALIVYQQQVLNAGLTVPWKGGGAMFTWPRTAVTLAFVGALTGVGFIDCLVKRIPNEVTMPGVLLAVVFSLAFPEMHPYPQFRTGYVNLDALLAALQGAIICGGALWLVGLVGTAALKKEAMGFGDVKLMAFAGAVTGWMDGLLAIALAAMIGSVVGVISLLITGKHKVPFGPFLVIGIGVMLIWGPVLKAAYWSFVTGVMQPATYAAPFFSWPV